jgi:hypothetical protein
MPRDPRRSPRRSRRVADLAALGLAALYLAVAVPLSLVRAEIGVARAVREAHETAGAALARVQGAAFADAIAAIRRVLPEDEPYLLVAENDPEEGDENWVRYELAPRRAVLVRGRPRSARRLRQRIPAGIRWVVVARGGGEPPALYPRFDYFQGIEEGR